MKMHNRCCVLMAALAVLTSAMSGSAEGPAWTDIPVSAWRGHVKVEVPVLKRKAAAAVAAPAKQAAPLVITSPAAQAAGVYQVRLTLRPSHVAGAVAFHSGVRIKAGATTVAEFPGALFARAHEPELRTFELVQPAGPVAFRVEAFTDGDVFQSVQTRSELKTGGPKLDDGLGALDPEKGPGGDVELELSLAPDKAVYFVVDRAEFRALSRSGRIASVETDKIRYTPGDTLRGQVTVADAGGKGGAGTVDLYLEHNVRDRVKVKSLAASLGASPQTLAFDIPLPREELGYALVAEYRSGDGVDRTEAAEYFNIASNFNRVALFGKVGATRDATLAEEPIRKAVAAARKQYVNACEYFAWAEEDMVEMSPDTDYWFSGQTCYHMNKRTLQDQIRLAHEQGVAIVTYGKFVMSGYLGWKTAYDYPNDHRNQYRYPVGMWEGVNVPILDRFRNKEFVPYSDRPAVSGQAFDVWWSEFLPINPDATPRRVRLAAEEVVRSIEMFGWDGIRWDGHPRGGGQCGSGGQYDQAAARRTQALVRYFKDLVGARFPAFGHGYNYFLIEKNPDPKWALEDYELDELARGGGLLMNESIGNASAGWTFESILRNLQVEGDLARERGGYLLGISFAKSARDVFIESALWAAAGCRPYNDAFSVAARRYCTRYSQYTFDESLRRLAAPEKILVPQAATRVLWQPFVYETPLAAGRRQIVMNLLNLPLEAKRPTELGKPEWDMPAGTDPVTFALALPEGFRATAANLIDPQTLDVTPLPVRENRLDVPPVAIWSVVVIDLAVDANAPPLASLCGVPRTLGVPRPELKEERKAEVVLDPKREVWEVNQDMSALTPAWSAKLEADQKAIDVLTWDEHNARLLALRGHVTPESLAKEWWKAGSLPADLALKDKPPGFGDLTPRRNGRFDIYHGRGALDDRLRLPQVLAGLGRFRVRDAPLEGLFRQSPAMGLQYAVGGAHYPEFDLVLLTGIPHCAIGAENSYALVDYVKAGGSVFFTGGEYAFGKGGYLFTVLERDLLPVLCVETVDTRYSDTPLPLEAGPDFDALNVKVDFGAKPAFWVWNQVALKGDPGIKVFLKSGNRPILVGWQVGKGRVACLLTDHRGRSGEGVTAFFDWPDWPRLARAVMQWLAPDAGRTEPVRTAVTAADIQTITGELARDSMAGDIQRALDTPPSGPGDDVSAPAADGLSGEALRKRVAVVRRLLKAPADSVPAAVLLDQLVTVGGLPDEVRWAAIDAVKAHPPANLADRIHDGLAASSPVLRQTACQMLGLADAAVFARELTSGVPALETDAAGRQRALALSLPLVNTAGLVDEGRRRVKQWNAQERKVLDRWTGGKPFSLAAPELPGLDAEALFERVAWLAYLSRHDPETCGAQFAREWLMTAEYQDYCDRSAANLWSRNMSPTDIRVAKVKQEEWGRLRAQFGRLREVTRPDLDRLLQNQPDRVAEGFRKAHFTAEFRLVMNLLGDQDPSAVTGILEKLKTADNADLAAFAAARLAP